MTKAAVNAIGRHATAQELAWADGDLLGWALRDPEALAAVQDYVNRHIR